MRNYDPSSPRRPAKDYIVVPPHGKAQIVCLRWPECMCGDDCIDSKPARSKLADFILIGLMVATALIGAGLLYVGLR